MINGAPEHSGRSEDQSKLSRPIASRRLVILFAMVVGLVAIISAGVIYQRNRQINRLPETIVSQATFPLYSPAKLPPGFKLNTNSFSATSQVVTFSITYEDNKKLIVSQQPTPSEFDFEKFYMNSLFGAKEVLTPLGKAVIGQIKDATFASVVTDRTWIIINAPAGLPADQMEQVVKSFTPINP